MDEEASPPSKKRKIRQSSLLDLLPKKGWFVIQFAERSETARQRLQLVSRSQTLFSYTLAEEYDLWEAVSD